MRVILCADVKGQGKKDQLVEVSDGYARNYLFPRKLAKPADNQAVTELKNKEAARQHKIDTDRAAALVLDEFRAGKLGRITLEMPQKPKPRLTIPGAEKKAEAEIEEYAHGED